MAKANRAVTLATTAAPVAPIVALVPAPVAAPVAKRTLKAVYPAAAVVAVVEGFTNPAKPASGMYRKYQALCTGKPVTVADVRLHVGKGNGRAAFMHHIVKAGYATVGSA